MICLNMNLPYIFEVFIIDFSGLAPLELVSINSISKVRLLLVSVDLTVVIYNQ